MVGQVVERLDSLLSGRPGSLNSDDCRRFPRKELAREYVDLLDELKLMRAGLRRMHFDLAAESAYEIRRGRGGD